jgi:hypothetical protein
MPERQLDLRHVLIPVDRPREVRLILIYALCDPRNGAIRYIGKCTHPQRRLRAHLNEKRDTRKCRWIASLRKLNLEPTLAVLEVVTADGWELSERKWIAYFKWAGADLCNHTEGGDGLHNPDNETRKKVSAHRKAQWRDNRERYLAVARDPERRRKISQANSGRKKPPEHVAKLWQNRPGRKLSETQRVKISQALLGNSYAKGSKRTKEQLEAQSRRQTGKRFPNRGPQSPESNMRRSLTQRGVPKSAEWKAKARIAALRRWSNEAERIAQSERITTWHENRRCL